ANNYGGGICVDMGNTENAANVTVGANGQGATESDANPKISGNMAMMSGGGLYVRGTNANVTINSGMIAQNKVSAYVKNQDVANEMGGVTLNDGLVTHVEVTFNSNGETVNNETTYTQKIVTNTNSKLARNRFERAGYKFDCWNTRADGLGESYSEGDAKPHSSDITLYAQWEAQ
ncbi:MAG: InlB B-repeat-containing protein, partial [Bacteroidaceae bacterium]|nr:InlB B-repeat-containing protein [Bacteroidaceae bacterium]